jgi:hypothetical protein
MLGRRDRSPKRRGIRLKQRLGVRLALLCGGGILASAAFAQTAATSPVVANDAPSMRVIPDPHFDPVAGVNVAGPSGPMQVMRERGRSGEAIVVVTPVRSIIPVAEATIEHKQSVTRAVMVAGSSVSPLHYRPDPVSEPKVTITPSGH